MPGIVGSLTGAEMALEMLKTRKRPAAELTRQRPAAIRCDALFLCLAWGLFFFVHYGLPWELECPVVLERSGRAGKENLGVSA